MKIFWCPIQASSDQNRAFQQKLETFYKSGCKKFLVLEFTVNILEHIWEFSDTLVRPDQARKKHFSSKKGKISEIWLEHFLNVWNFWYPSQAWSDQKIEFQHKIKNNTEIWYFPDTLARPDLPKKNILVEKQEHSLTPWSGLIW